MKLLRNWKIKLPAIQIFLIAVGILSITAGIYREEVKIVVMKAIYICLECIGIG